MLFFTSLFIIFFCLDFDSSTDVCVLVLLMPESKQAASFSSTRLLIHEPKTQFDL